MSRKRKLFKANMWAAIDTTQKPHPFLAIEGTKDEAKKSAAWAYGYRADRALRAWPWLKKVGVFLVPVSVRELPKKRRGK